MLELFILVSLKVISNVAGLKDINLVMSETSRSKSNFNNSGKWLTVPLSIVLQELRQFDLQLESFPNLLQVEIVNYKLKVIDGEKNFSLVKNNINFQWNFNEYLVIHL